MTLIILKALKIALGVIFLKSGMAKVKKPMSFYFAFMDYKVTRNNRVASFLIPFLISLEVLLALLLIISVFPLATLIIGLALQLFYIFLILFNINKEFEDNCGCFGFSTPRIPTLKHFIVNIVLLLSIVILYGISNNI